MSVAFPRCNECGKQLSGYDLWLYRHARSVKRDVKKCQRCNAKKGDIEGNAARSGSTRRTKGTEQ
jgi:hypothetical protein